MKDPIALAGRLTWVWSSVFLVLLAAAPAAAESFEVWLVDQSNTADRSFGGTIHVFDGVKLSGTTADVSPVATIDLGGATTSLCQARTAAAPVRPHMLFFNATDEYAVLSFVVSGHVVIFHAATREPIQCFRTAVGAGGARQAHAAVPSPDDRFILVANQNGKLVGSLGFVTLRGGGLFVVDPRATPMKIIAEYDRQTVHGNGCGGVEAAGAMFLDSGGGTAANLSEFDVYRFPLTGYAPAHPPNTPAQHVVFSDDVTPDRDGHGITATRAGRYIWVTDRHANLIEVFNALTDDRHTLDLTSADRPDPSPDLMDLSPAGNRMFVSLRGSIPLTGDPHVSTGSSPGLMVIRIEEGGRRGEVMGIVRVSNIGADGIDRADPHGIRVRRR